MKEYEVTVTGTALLPNKATEQDIVDALGYNFNIQDLSFKENTNYKQPKEKAYLVYDTEVCGQYYGIFLSFTDAQRRQLEVADGFIESLKDADPKETGIDIYDMPRKEFDKLYKETLDTIGIKEFNLEGDVE